MEDKKALKIDDHFRTLYEHNPDAIFSINLEGKLISSNPAAVKISGYSLDELRNMGDFTDLLVPEEIPKAEGYFSKALKGDPQYFGTAILHKNGNRVEVDVSSVPSVVNGRIVGVYGISWGITSRKKTEEALKTSKERYDLASYIGKVTFDNYGKPIRMMGTVQDITERKQAGEGAEPMRGITCGYQ